MPELLHPRMSDVYREKVGSLCLALENEENRTGAADAIRALVEAIVLEPDGAQLKITLTGDLAGMLSAARETKRSPDTGDLMVQISWLRGRDLNPQPLGCDPDERDSGRVSFARSSRRRPFRAGPPLLPTPCALGGSPGCWRSGRR